MKLLKKIFIFTLTILLITPSFVFAREAFTIDTYDVNINVKEDNSYEITEIINADFGNNKRHGLYRNIPIITSATRNINGKDKKTTQLAKVKDVSVENHKFSEQYELDNYVIKIGDKDKYVTGKQKYIIKYTYILGDDGISAFDDIYYNLIGNDWDTTIDKVNFTINMPKDFDKNLINFTSGAYGNTKDNVEYKVQDNKIIGYTTSILNPHESVTVRIELPDGYFNTSYILNKIYDIISLALLGSFLIIVIILFKKYGKDDMIFKQVEFYPPEDLSPPEIAYIAKSGVDTKDIVSLIVYFASKGYIKIIEESKKLITLEKLKSIPSNAKAFEKVFFDALFKKGDKISTKTLKNSVSFGESVLSCISSVSDEFSSDEKRLSSKKSIKAQIISSLLLCFVTIISFFLSIYQVIFIFGYALLISSVLTVIAGLFVALLIFTIKKGHYNDKFNKKALVILEFTIFLVLGFIISFLISTLGPSFIAMFLQFIIIAVTGMFIGLMYKRSDYCNKMLGKVLGFKDFLEKAEKDRIEMLVEENPSYFFDILPYAYVLDVSDKWIKQFEGIAIESPYWYSPYNSGDFLTHYLIYSSLTRDLNHINTHANSAILTSSAGSGGGFGGGGGFSGGGFGGGGGGSW